MKKNRLLKCLACLGLGLLRSKELEDGFGLIFDDQKGRARKIMDVVLAEKNCCPFIRFEMVIGGYGGEIQVSLRGNALVKAFLRRELLAG